MSYTEITPGGVLRGDALVTRSGHAAEGQKRKSSAHPAEPTEALPSAPGETESRQPEPPEPDQPASAPSGGDPALAKDGAGGESGVNPGHQPDPST